VNHHLILLYSEVGLIKFLSKFCPSSVTFLESPLATETASHLFLHCNFAGKVWYDIIRWLGVIVILPHNILSSLAVLISCAKNKKERAGLCLIWNAYVWVIWCGRNDCIFNSGEVSIEDVTDQIKMLSWKWFIGRRAKGPCLFYEWKWSRLDCLLR
jgi:hypothetical protein